MKQILDGTFILLVLLLTACQTATPLPPVTGTEGGEFSLAADQTATITNTDLTIRLIGVAGDERCPSEIECAMSGPVSLSLSVQQGQADPAAINLQTFTDNTGRTPDMQFEGIKDREVVGGYLIRVRSVTPYPSSPSKKIKASEYRVVLIVTQE
jgi:hypothetical protein